MSKRKTIHKEGNITVENINGGKTVIFSFKEFLPIDYTLESYTALKKAYIKQILDNSDILDNYFLFFTKTYTVKRKLEVFGECYFKFNVDIDFKTKCKILMDKFGDITKKEDD